MLRAVGLDGDSLPIQAGIGSGAAAAACRTVNTLTACLVRPYRNRRVAHRILHPAFNHTRHQTPGRPVAKVFISYRGVDEPAATRLASALRRAGHEVFYAEWELGVGDSIVGWANQRLGESRYVLLCLSSSGLSDWVNAEWMSTFMRQLGGHGIRLLPVNLTGGEAPPLLADLKRADLVADWDRGLGQLLAALDRKG
jgi:hypothetical protein